MGDSTGTSRAVIVHDTSGPSGAPDLRIWVIPDELTSRDRGALDASATSTIVTFLVPGGPGPDPRSTDRDRVDGLLEELGWRRTSRLSPELVPGQPVEVPVHRVPQFRTDELIGPGNVAVVSVVNNDGEPMARYPLGSSTVRSTLEGKGWEPGQQLEGWLMPTLGVTPADWRTIIQEATAERASTMSVAKEAERRWSALVREAVLSGQDVRELADWARVTPQRIYQIRDRRR